MTTAPKKITDEKRQEYYAALGMAIASWHSFELRLGVTFQYLLKTDPFDLGLLTFETVNSFRDKLLLFDAVLQRKITDVEIHAKWDKLRNRITRLATKRNRLAHGLTTIITLEDGPEMFIGPPFSKHGVSAVVPEKRQKVFRSTHQIKHLEKAFDLLAMSIVAFAFQVIEQLKRQGSAAEPRYEWHLTALRNADHPKAAPTAKAP